MNSDRQEFREFLRPGISGKEFLRAGAVSVVLHVLAIVFAVAAGIIHSAPEKAPKPSEFNVSHITLSSPPASRIHTGKSREKGPEPAAAAGRKTAFPQRKERTEQPAASSPPGTEPIREKALNPDSQVTAAVGTEPPNRRNEMTLVVPAAGTDAPSGSGLPGKEQGSGTLSSGPAIHGNDGAPGADTTATSNTSRYKQNPPPLYPQAARRKGYEGLVVLSVEILENGSPGKLFVKKSSGYDILDRAALDAVKKWKFVPAVKDHVRIRSWGVVPIRFVLQD